MKSHKGPHCLKERVGSLWGRINQIVKDSQANRRKGGELSTTVSGCTQLDGSLRRKVPGLNCSCVCLEWPLDTLFSYGQSHAHRLGTADS